MAADGTHIIYMDPPPRARHQINRDAVGSGRRYKNQATYGDRCIIGVEVGVPWQALSKRLIFLHKVGIACNVGTDMPPTILLGNIADKLHLQPTDPFFNLVSTSLGSVPGWWCKHELWISLGSGYMELEVWFPVQLGHNGWEWRYSFPHWNVLGMRDVLNQRMLCITSDEMYAFQRL
jgi:hypothetical protein